MKAYFTDFRQKILEVYENEQISQRQLAKRFRVALSFIYCSSRSGVEVSRLDLS
jgi:transposase